jgi:hypothetical protein
MNLTIARRLLGTTTVKGVIDVISEISESGTRIAWKPVGENDNNLAIINLGSDPAAGLIERITNAIDAVLELEWNEKRQPSAILSPRMAAEKWFGVKDGRLVNFKRDDLRKLDTISAKVQITLRDSDRQDKPTLDVRDYGIGLLPEDFGNSILSLNKNRKLRKLFLAGAFGQGGSTALSYSPFTAIFSRRAKSSGIHNPFCFTIVRFNPGDPNIDKHGVYEYMVDHANGCPISVDIPETEFLPGTLVRQYTMEIGKYSAVMTAPTGSLWFLVHNYLFDPVLPFKIEDARKGKTSSLRTVAGNHRLLTLGEHTEYQRSASLTFKDGSVFIKWWVLSAEGESARSRITQYVMASKPIVVTYNGQKQGDFPNTIIKDDLKLPYLDRYLVVHVDCDRLDAESRRQLFPTTREALRDTPIGDDLRRLITETLSGDTELRRLDHERKLRYIQHEDRSIVENIRKRLANRVKVFTLTGGTGRGPGVTPPDRPEPEPPLPRQPIPIQDPPTFLKITNSSPRKIVAGRSFTLRFETDARPDYFVNPDNFIAVLSPPSLGQYTGTANVRDGYGVAYFKSHDDIGVGTQGKIVLEVRPPRAPALSDSIEIEVVDLPQNSGPEEGQSRTPNINPHWVSQGDPFWADNGWTTKSVARVTREEDSIDIYVSADNERLSQVIAKAQRRNITAVDIVKNFYLEHVSFFSLLQDIDRAEQPQAKTTDADDDEDYDSDASLRHACETVCGIIDGMFEVLVVSELS